MHIRISHTTRYTYDQEVRFLPHLLFLRPRDNPLLQVNRFAFTFQPEAKINWMRDDFDNLVASVQFLSDSATLEIRFECEVTTTDTQPFDFLVRDYARTFPFSYEPLHRFNLSIYLTPLNLAEQSVISEWLQAHVIYRPTETVSWIFTLNQTIFKNLRYQRRNEPGIQSVLTTLALGSGSCRDFAVLMIACARSLGMAARFVSGYLYDSLSNDTTLGDMHAWVEIFLPGAGWRGVDPTHGIFCDNAYVPVAHAVVPESVNPIQGTFISATSSFIQLNAEVRVRRNEAIAYAAETFCP